MDSRMTIETSNFIFDQASTYLKFLGSKDPKNNIEHYFESRAENFRLDSVEEKHFNFEGINYTKFENLNNESKILIIFFHGGGFKLFSTKSYRPLLMILSVVLNVKIISIDYTKVPENTVSQMVVQCLKVTRHILTNEQYKLFGFLGDSAGGNIAAQLAFNIKSSFLILIYPWLDLTMSSKYIQEFGSFNYLLDKKQMRLWALDAVKNNEQELKLNSPVFFDNFEILPKTLLTCGTLDPLFGDSEMFYYKCLNAKVNCEFYQLEGCVHGYFGSFYKYTNAFYKNLFKIKNFIDNI